MYFENLILLVLFIGIIITILVYRDAKKVGFQSPGLWAFITMVGNGLGLLIYFAARSQKVNDNQRVQAQQYYSYTSSNDGDYNIPQIKNAINEDSRFCTNCGKELSKLKISKYCPFCGTELH
jgi:hypothetical protein